MRLVATVLASRVQALNLEPGRHYALLRYSIDLFTYFVFVGIFVKEAAEKFRQGFRRTSSHPKKIRSDLTLGIASEWARCLREVLEIEQRSLASTYVVVSQAVHKRRLQCFSASSPVSLKRTRSSSAVHFRALRRPSRTG